MAIYVHPYMTKLFDYAVGNVSYGVFVCHVCFVVNLSAAATFRLGRPELLVRLWVRACFAFFLIRSSILTFICFFV